MLPVVSGDRETRRQIVIYSLILVPVTLLPVAIGMSGWIYGIAAAVLGAGFLLHALRVWRDTGETAARPMFLYSILYLSLIFIFLLIDRGVTGLI
jgi:protoheme IX farnesyltransferase